MERAPSPSRRRTTSRSPARRGRSTTPTRRARAADREEVSPPPRPRSPARSTTPTRGRGRPRSPARRAASPTTAPVERSPARTRARDEYVPTTTTVSRLEVQETLPQRRADKPNWRPRVSLFTIALATLMLVEFICLLALEFPRPPVPIHNILTFLRTQAYLAGFTLILSIPLLVLVESPVIAFWMHVLTAIPSIVFLYWMACTHDLWRYCKPEYTDGQKFCVDFPGWYLNFRGFTVLLLTEQVVRSLFAIVCAYRCYYKFKDIPTDELVTTEVAATIATTTSSSTVSARSTKVKHRASVVPAAMATLFELFSLWTLLDGFSWVFKHEGSPEWQYINMNQHFGNDGQIIAALSIGYLPFLLYAHFSDLSSTTPDSSSSSSPSPALRLHTNKLSRTAFSVGQFVFLFATLMSLAWEETNWHIWHPELESDHMMHYIWFQKLMVFTTLVVLAQILKVMTILVNLYHTLMGMMEDTEGVSTISAVTTRLTSSGVEREEDVMVFVPQNKRRTAFPESSASSESDS